MSTPESVRARKKDFFFQLVNKKRKLFFPRYASARQIQTD